MSQTVDSVAGSLGRGPIQSQEDNSGQIRKCVACYAGLARTTEASEQKERQGLS